MKTVKRIAATAAFLLAAATIVADAGQTLTIEHAAELGVAADRQVLTLTRRLDDQLDALGLSGYLDGITLSLGGSLDGDATSSPSVSGTATLSAGLEIIPQLSLSGRLSANGSANLDGSSSTTTGTNPVSASLSLTLSPFANSTGQDREELDADYTAVELENAIAAAGYEAVTSLLDAVAAQMEAGLAAENLRVLQISLENTQALYEYDRATDDELRAAEDAVRSAEQQLVRLQLSAKREVSALANTLGIEAAAAILPASGDLELEAMEATASEALATADAANLATTDPAVAATWLDVQNAQLDLDAARTFSPDLDITASGGLPNWQYGLGVELSVSPADWDGTAVTEAEYDLALAHADYEYALRLAEYDATAALNEIRFALEDVESDRDDLADAEDDLAEAAFRLERGDITDLENEQAALDVLQAAHDVTVAQMNLMTKWLAVEYGQY